MSLRCILKACLQRRSFSMASRSISSISANSQLIRRLPSIFDQRKFGSTISFSQADTEQKVMEVIKKFDKVNPAEVSLDVPFTKMGLDSLDVVEVVIALEEEFQLEIPDAIADKAQNLKDISEYIYKFLNPHKEVKQESFSEEH